MAALPDVEALAACSEEELFKLWEGLGYYSRARNLQKAARLICERYGGRLPASYEELKTLPGVGDYTAGAIASIAFGLPAPAVDGNVLRVFARLYNDRSDIADPAARRRFTRRVMDQQPAASPGPFNEALRAGFGSFIGFLVGTLLKFIVCIYFTYEFIAAFF